MHAAAGALLSSFAALPCSFFMLPSLAGFSVQILDSDGSVQIQLRSGPGSRGRKNETEAMEDRVRGRGRSFIGWRSSIRGEGFFGSKSNYRVPNNRATGLGWGILCVDG